MKADDVAAPLVKYGLTAEEAGREPIVARHFEVTETDRLVQHRKVLLSLHKLAALRATGQI
ncbi:hypothetical protein [Blastomonas sp.]|uniref:hypothetical protein n=1 Tax=Blastomonas sp. TaxID=1909299 RepID=UPI00406A5E83